MKIVIAKTGYNALTETNPNNLIFTSDYSTLKYSIDGSDSITIVGNGSLQSSSVDIAHNLGDYVYFIVYVNDPTNTGQYNRAPRDQGAFASVDGAYAYLTNVNTLRLIFYYNGASTLTQTFYYKIFKNKLGF